MFFSKFKEIKGVFILDRQFSLIAVFLRNSLVEVGLVEQIFLVGLVSIWWMSTFFDQPNFLVIRI